MENSGSGAGNSGRDGLLAFHRPGSNDHNHGMELSDFTAAHFLVSWIYLLAKGL
ncbi:MAG: hypothetical protein JWQ71_1005 [Pedosphaera sp.]|nr:hypothetical protein [Pedosphaera sp.]